MTAAPYRLTIYIDGLIDRMLPFSSLDQAGALVFADNQRYGRHAVLSDAAGLVRVFPSDAIEAIVERLRRRG